MGLNTRSPSASSGQEAIAAVEQAWNDGAANWDADRLAALYTRDAAFFGGRSGHSTGRDAVRDYFASYRGQILSARLTFEEIRVFEVGDRAFVVQGFAHFSFVLADQSRTRSRLRATLLIVCADGSWQIRQHHLSTTPDAPPLGQGNGAERPPLRRLE
jgi:uncharacterized protein (TIGR02246 family)